MVAPNGVAIGLGLLSSSLRDNEHNPTVTGTIVSDGIQEDRLEVIFALREVRKAHLFMIFVRFGR